MVVVEGQVGPRYVTDGANTEFRQSRLGGIVTADGHARFYESVSRGNVYHASMQAGASLGTALTATAVTLTLYNPINSGRYLVLIEGTLSITTGLAAAGTAAVVYAGNVSTTAAAPSATTPATVRNSLLGGTNGVGLAYTAATLPATPVVLRNMATFRLIGATPVSESVASLVDNIDGKLILAPNTAVTIQSIGGAISGIVSLTWEEIQI